MCSPIYITSFMQKQTSWINSFPARCCSDLCEFVPLCFPPSIRKCIATNRFNPGFCIFQCDELPKWGLPMIQDTASCSQRACWIMVIWPAHAENLLTAAVRRQTFVLTCLQETHFHGKDTEGKTFADELFFFFHQTTLQSKNFWSKILNQLFLKIKRKWMWQQKKSAWT